MVKELTQAAGDAGYFQSAGQAHRLEREESIKYFTAKAQADPTPGQIPAARGQTVSTLGDLLMGRFITFWKIICFTQYLLV